MTDVQHAWVFLPRSLSSACINVDGKIMLCGRSGLVAGLVPTGLGGAYEKHFVRGEMAVFCFGRICA